MDPIVTQCRFLIASADPLFAGLDDSHRALEPTPRTKTAGWLIGHLSVTGDFGRKLCAVPPMCPKPWRAAFNPGSQPSVNPSDYPPMPELIAAFRAVYTDLCTTLPAAAPSALAAPNAYTPSLKDFPTAGDFVTYLMTGHLGYHLGQLSAWRAAAGLRR
jgi:hypothetical protein